MQVHTKDKVIGKENLGYEDRREFKIQKGREMRIRGRKDFSV